MACRRAALGGSAKTGLPGMGSTDRCCSYCTNCPIAAQVRQSTASPARPSKRQIGRTTHGRNYWTRAYSADLSSA